MELTKLHNGLQIPRMFFGTYRAGDHDNVVDVMGAAYRVGYRAFDSASFYKNEAEVGEAIEALGIADDVLVTTKVWNDVEGYDAVLKDFERSRRNLRGKLDLYLLHWPAHEFLSRWKALEHLYEQGEVAAIGVSNFKAHHLEELAAHANIAPMLNQIEAHACFMDWPTIAYCHHNDIALQAWRPLMRTGGLLQNENVAAIGAKVGKTAAQVALRFLLQSGVDVLPKSVHEDRMRENLNVFDFALSPSDMEFMRGLHTGVRTAGDPDTFFLP